MLSVLLLGAWLVMRNLKQSEGAAETTAPTPAPLATEPEKSMAQMLSEADALLAAGDEAGALKLLREAVQAELTDAEAQRRLGDLLLRSGARLEAIDAYRAAVAADPQSVVSLKSLAAAEFDEGLFSESVESYRKLVTLEGNGGPPSEDVQLALGDALRSAGQFDEAKVSFEKLALSSSEEVAKAARERLTELAKLQASGAPMPVPDPTRAARNRNNQLTPAPIATTPSVVAVASNPAPLPTPAPVQPREEPTKLSPSEQYRRGVDLWSSNRAAAVGAFLQAAQSVPDANYYLGLNIAEGRDPKSLGRAQLVSALYYFQVAQKGPHGAQARRYADQLGQEYDRRRSGN
ncbi:MAG: tetratricopeptide repeat protein [Pyrinomonadaceae bacterium]